jgi:hypothetical protein
MSLDDTFAELREVHDRLVQLLHARSRDLTALADELAQTEALIQRASAQAFAEQIRAGAESGPAVDGRDAITGEAFDALGPMKFELVDGHLVIDGVDHGGGVHAHRLMHLLQHPPGDPEHAFVIVRR